MTSSTPPRPLSLDATARATADRLAGATLPDLTTRLAEAQHAYANWIASYEAALDAASRARAADVLALPPLTVPDAAKALNCGTTKVRELVKRGRLRTVPGLGDIVRIVRADVARLAGGDDAERAA